MIAGNLTGLYRYNTATVTWALIPPNGTAPSERNSFGFAATPDYALYVFGGLSLDDGEEGEEGGC